MLIILLIIHTAIEIGFDRADYTVTELDGFVDLIITKTGIIDRDLDLTFETQSGSAEGVFTTC